MRLRDCSLAPAVACLLTGRGFRILDFPDVAPFFAAPHPEQHFFRYLWAHELGHYADRVVTRRPKLYRRAFRRALRLDREGTWQSGHLYGGMLSSASELFADAFAWCALYGDRGVPVDVWHAVRAATYRYDPTHPRNRGVCAIVRSMSRSWG